MCFDGRCCSPRNVLNDGPMANALELHDYVVRGADKIYIG